MLKFNLSAAYFSLLSGIIILSASCISPKDTVTSRSMQNLTARYNIIYNANILLTESADNIEKSYLDDFGQLLTIYKEPSEAISASEKGNLDSVIQKANTIVNEKLNSNYVDDAYLLVAKANYLKANFFNAAEYFTYIYNTYFLEKDTRQESLVWKARALMQLQNFGEASNTLDTALKYVENSKANKADVYATYTQLLISNGKEADAITMLQKAIESTRNKQNKIRWTYILAQLQEEEKQYQDAYTNFSKVVKSNASFEMAFHANLNRIRIEDEQSGKDIDRVTRLKSLLNDDKNKDFIDQIYYQLGNLYYDQKQTDKAIENYNISIQKSNANQNQKGLSFLSLADIYFNQADYVRAKTYYDSTLSTLSPRYPGYELIRKKGSNLELLASRFRTIAREDTLQSLARLPDEQREKRIAELVRENGRTSIGEENRQAAPNNMIAGIDNPAQARSAEGKFYFNNSAAISQGFPDFKRKWGNRRLEDNWRRVAKSAEESTLSMAVDPDAPVGASLATNTRPVNPETLKQDYLKDLPLTEPQLRQSNQRIAEAYYDIANFYKDDLRDEGLAIQTYEDLLKHTPQSMYNLPVYYNLYRLYQQKDIKKSNEYRDLILSGYPDSPFAKIINDPNYSSITDEKEVALNSSYNELYTLYSQKKYSELIPSAEALEQHFPNSKLSPQIAYLRVMALGHTQKLDNFESNLQTIIITYPNDIFITPLVKQHLEYIRSNRVRMAARKTALLDFDPLEPAPSEETFAGKQPPVATAQPQSTGDIPLPGALSKDSPALSDSQQPSSPNTDPTQAKSNPASPFSLPGSAQYYFVVNVLNPAATLSSSRFGIGQFNRTKYAGSALKHQLQEINNENQLILVGIFENYKSVKAYESAILPLLQDIMKVPAQQYTTFVATKESLDKLQNRQLINTYIEFYRNSN